MKTSHSFHGRSCFSITKICVIFERFPWVKNHWICTWHLFFIVVYSWRFWSGYLGCWVSWQTNFKPQEDTKQNITEAASPQCPGWSHKQPEQTPGRAAEPGWGCREAAQPRPPVTNCPCRPVCWQAKETDQTFSHNSSSSASKTLLTLYRWKEKHIL